MPSRSAVMLSCPLLKSAFKLANVLPSTSVADIFCVPVVALKSLFIAFLFTSALAAPALEKRPYKYTKRAEPTALEARAYKPNTKRAEPTALEARAYKPNTKRAADPEPTLVARPYKPKTKRAPEAEPTIDARMYKPKTKRTYKQKTKRAEPTPALEA